MWMDKAQIPNTIFIVCNRILKRDGRAPIGKDKCIHQLLQFPRLGAILREIFVKTIIAEYYRDFNWCRISQYRSPDVGTVKSKTFLSWLRHTSNTLQGD